MIIFINVAIVKNARALPSEPVRKYGIKKLLQVINALHVIDLLMVLGCPSLKNLSSLGLRFH